MLQPPPCGSDDDIETCSPPPSTPPPLRRVPTLTDCPQRLFHDEQRMDEAQTTIAEEQQPMDGACQRTTHGRHTNDGARTACKWRRRATHERWPMLAPPMPARAVHHHRPPPQLARQRMSSMLVCLSICLHPGATVNGDHNEQ
ncbi:hypothetical protein BJ912DRAFT_1138044 [Pholiota molesta]|nr:hypothetical protein BJ912DRAFT_1052910 [Pholiota molesta]KAF8202868.1 hypothetical protein BJ912DRAFT_1138044 [Pholiota molesta]